MKSAVITFPGSNRERDMMYALELTSGVAPVSVWHADTTLPDVDLVVLPGGFSYGDYLRSGAIAARAPIMDAVRDHAEKGRLVLGVCNGFQMLTEAGLAARRPDAQRRPHLRLPRGAAGDNLHRQPLHARNDQGRGVALPRRPSRRQLFCRRRHDQDAGGPGPVVAFRYARGTNPNGSINDIAGITNDRGNVLGMMPHPENLVDPLQGGTDGRAFFESALSVVAA
jgi:phosphoribosylformylglycinamidine (FGAM) synthase-like amidotransferase family enzyme